MVEAIRLLTPFQSSPVEIAPSSHFTGQALFHHFIFPKLYFLIYQKSLSLSNELLSMVSKAKLSDRQLVNQIKKGQTHAFDLLFYSYTQLKKLFVNPSSEYLSAPLWAWNDLIKAEGIAFQLQEFKNAGID